MSEHVHTSIWWECDRCHRTSANPVGDGWPQGERKTIGRRN